MPTQSPSRVPPPGRRRATSRRVARARLVALSGLVLLGLVACGPDPVPPPSAASSSAASAPGAPAPSGTPGQAPASPATPPSTAPPPGVAAPGGRCRSDGLSARFQPLPDDLGAHQVAVVWTNTGDRPCTMAGFGGVDLQGPNDPTYGPTFSLRRSAEDPSTVTLAPRATALSVIHYLSPDAPGPTWTPTSALVTPPDETRSVPLRWTFGPVLRQDAATRPGTFLSPVRSADGRSGPTTCRPDQVTAAVVDQDAGASNRYARLELTARRGQSCRLAGPLAVGVRSAGPVPVRSEGGRGLGATQLDATHPASSTLHWTVAADRRVTPQALTVTLPGGPVTVRWTFGPVDATATQGIAVGPLTAGTGSR